MIMVNYATFHLITDPDLCERCYLHDFTYLTGFQVVRNKLCQKGICMKFEYVCKPVFCEYNLPVVCGSHIHSCDKTWKKGTYDLLYKNPYFLVSGDYFAKSDGVFTELQKNSDSFIIWFDFSDSIEGSFTIDTQMPIVIFFFFFFWGGDNLQIH